MLLCSGSRFLDEPSNRVERHVSSFKSLFLSRMREWENFIFGDVLKRRNLTKSDSKILYLVKVRG